MEINEIFKPIAGYEGKYEVSNHGRVKSIGGKFRLAGDSFIGAVDKLGYVATTLRQDGRRLCIRVHTLVANAFLSKPESNEPLCVNHIDGDKANNRVDNLEWATFRENNEHAVSTGLHNLKGEKHPVAKLSESDVLEIRELYKTCSQRYIAERFNVKRRHLSDVITGKCWGHLPVLDYSGCPKFKHMYPKGSAKLAA